MPTPGPHPVTSHRVDAGPALSLDADGLGRLTGLFQLLSDRTRLTILQILGEHGERNVTTLCNALGLPQPTVSHHLGQLRKGHLVRNRRQGKQVFYSLDGRYVSPATLPRDEADDEDGGKAEVDLDGSTPAVGSRPTGLQIALPSLAVQIVTRRGIEADLRLAGPLEPSVTAS